MIGSHVKIQNNVSVYEGVILEDYVFCDPSMVFTNVRTPCCEYPHRRRLYRCANQTRRESDDCLRDGAGEKVFVGVGTVVTKDVPDYAMVYGNPAQVKGYICAPAAM